MSADRMSAMTTKTEPGLLLFLRQHCTPRVCEHRLGDFFRVFQVRFLGFRGTSVTHFMELSAQQSMHHRAWYIKIDHEACLVFLAKTQNLLG